MKYYKFCLWKAYFDKGYSLMSYPKLILLFAGGGSIVLTQGQSTGLVVILALLFGIWCFLLGLVWFKQKIVDAEHEVQNVVNPFVREMRKNYKAKN